MRGGFRWRVLYKQDVYVPGAWVAVPAVPEVVLGTVTVGAPVPAVGVPGTVPAPAGDVLGALEAVLVIATAVPVPAREAARTPVQPAVPAPAPTPAPAAPAPVPAAVRPTAPVSAITPAPVKTRRN